ncbi:hypothetical protein [Rhodopila sp.]|uniref:hypothetical protein n=1 Tax=Rhodopila sp. TaxID=2480087 RepID=UPI003D105C33
MRQALTTHLDELEHGSPATLTGTNTVEVPAGRPRSDADRILDPAALTNAQTGIRNWKLPTAQGLPVLDIPTPPTLATEFPAWPRAVAAMGVAVLPDPTKDVSDRRATELACLLLDRTTTASLYGQSPLFNEHDVCQSLWGTPQLAVEALISTGASAWRAKALPDLLRSAPRPPFALLLRLEATLDEYDRASHSYAVHTPFSVDGTSQVLGTSLDLHLPTRWPVSEQDAIAFETRRGKRRPLTVYLGVPAVITNVVNLQTSAPVNPATGLPQGAVWTIQSAAATIYDDPKLEHVLQQALARQDTTAAAAFPPENPVTSAAADATALTNARDAARRWDLRTVDGMLLLQMNADILQFSVFQQDGSGDLSRAQRDSMSRALIAAGLAADPGELASIPDPSMRLIGCELLSPQRRQVLFGQGCQNPGSIAAPGQEFALRDAVATFRNVDLPSILAQAPHLPLALLVQSKVRFDPWDPIRLGFKVAAPNRGSPNLFGTSLPFAYPQFWPATEAEARHFVAERPLKRSIGGPMADYSAVLSVPVTLTGLRQLAAYPRTWAQSEVSGLWNDRAWRMTAADATLYDDSSQSQVLYRYGPTLLFPTAIEGTKLAEAPRPAGAVAINSETPVLLAERMGSSAIPRPDWATLARNRLSAESYFRNDPGWAQKDSWGVFFTGGLGQFGTDLPAAEVEQYREWTVKRAAAMPDTLELRQDTSFSSLPRQIHVLDRQTGSSWLGSQPENYGHWAKALADRGISAEQLLPVTLSYPVAPAGAATAGRQTQSGQSLAVLLAVPRPWRDYVLDAPAIMPSGEQAGQPNPTLPTLGANVRVVGFEEIALEPATSAHALLVKLQPVEATLRSSGKLLASTSFPEVPWPPAIAPAEPVTPAVSSPLATSRPAVGGVTVTPPVRRAGPDPEQRLSAGPYGPDILGIRIGMPLADAEALVRGHMNVTRVLETAPPPAGSAPELHGKLFVASDRATSYFSEEIALYDSPSPQPDKVIAVTRTLYVGDGVSDRILRGLTDKYGQPDVQLSSPGAPAWGDGDRLPCLAGGPGRNLDWIENGQALPHRPDASVQQNIVPRPPGGNEPRERYDSCGPTITSSVAGSESMADGRPLQRFTTRLFDPALLARLKARWMAAPLTGGAEIKY